MRILDCVWGGVGGGCGGVQTQSWWKSRAGLRKSERSLSEREVLLVRTQLGSGGLEGKRGGQRLQHPLRASDNQPPAQRKEPRPGLCLSNKELHHY